MKMKLIAYAMTLLSSAILFCANYTVDNKSDKDCVVQYFRGDTVEQQNVSKNKTEKPHKTGGIKPDTKIKVFCGSSRTPLKGNQSDSYTFGCTSVLGIKVCGNTKDKIITISKGGQLFDVVSTKK